MPDSFANKDILAALCTFEADGKSADLPKSIFLHKKAWFIKKGARGFFSSLKIPGTQLRSILPIFMNPQEAVALKSQADALQGNEDMTRLRAFYLSQKQCLKVVSAKGDIGERTRIENTLRKKVENLQTIRLPHIKHIDEKQDYIYIVEEMVEGRQFRFSKDAEKFIEQGIPQLLNTYKALGVEEVRVSSCFPPSLAEDFEALFLGQYNDFANEVRDILSGVSVTLSGTCHGDLLPSNLGIQGDDLYFFDWEKSFEGPLLKDMLRLVFKKPKKTDNIAHAVLKEYGKKFGVSFPDILNFFTVYTAWSMLQKPSTASSKNELWQRVAVQYR